MLVELGHSPIQCDIHRSALPPPLWVVLSIVTVVMSKLALGFTDEIHSGCARQTEVVSPLERARNVRVVVWGDARLLGAAVKSWTVRCTNVRSYAPPRDAARLHRRR